ncbi:MAG TPA: MoaD/ThiS family protein [Thermodesulfovibrionales bacterium]|nr:MoaD/ThiS family protein [Thermodesulfovibrionales bacterium]
MIEIMKVVVRLFASLRSFGPEQQDMELAEHSTLEDLIKMLKLPEKIPLLKIVNGEHRSMHYGLKEGDEIALFPPIAGGSGGNVHPGDSRELFLRIEEDCVDKV